MRAIDADLLREHPELAGIALPRLTRYIPEAHDPTANPKQAAFLLLQCLEAAYGGAAGGGKSDALLMAALQYVDMPDYSALILRRTYQDLSLPGALMDRAEEWLRPTDARWSTTDKTWRFPSGATLTFGYVQHPGDERRYGSAEFQFIGIDELAEWPDEKQYRFLFSRLRRLEGLQIPLRVRVAFNPIGPGAPWIKRRFVEEGRQAVNEITGEAEPRPFVPALMTDNPFLDTQAYRVALAQLDPTTREALEHGRWLDAAAGSYFRRANFHRITEGDLPRDKWGRIEPLELCRAWDLAASEEIPGINDDPDWTAGLLIGRHELSGLWIVLDVRRGRFRPAGVETFIKQTADRDRAWAYRLGYADPEIWLEQEPGASGKTVVDYYLRHVLVGYPVQGQPSSGDKAVRARPVSGAADAGLISVLEGPWHTEFFDEAESFPGGGHDDQVDALSLGFGKLAERAGAFGEGPRLWR